MDLITLLIAHWIGDALFQYKKLATEKYRDMWALIAHVMIYTVVMLWTGVLLEISIPKLQVFLLITFFTHLVIDFITSKITHYLYEKGIYYTQPLNMGFFSIIVLDQMLHITQLILTYQWITSLP